MEKTDEFISNRLIWKARHYKLPTKFVLYFHDLPIKIQQNLKEQLEEESSGTPVLFFEKPSKEWTLICTRQVIGYDNKSIIKINLSEIEHLKPYRIGDFKEGEKFDINTMKKAEWSELLIIDKQNNHYVLHANKGSDFFALWNILLMIARIES